MIRLFAVAASALIIATSSQAMSPAQLNQPGGMTTQIAFFCGPGRTLVGGVCMSRVAKRQLRRCAVWGAGHVCRRWY